MFGCSGPSGCGLAPVGGGGYQYDAINITHYILRRSSQTVYDSQSIRQVILSFLRQIHIYLSTRCMFRPALTVPKRFLSLKSPAFRYYTRTARMSLKVC